MPPLACSPSRETLITWNVCLSPSSEKFCEKISPQYNLPGVQYYKLNFNLMCYVFDKYVKEGSQGREGSKHYIYIVNNLTVQTQDQFCWH